ncbi:hypothetical protein BLOT_012239, partial [Blomia tropicalis]
TQRTETFWILLLICYSNLLIRFSSFHYYYVICTKTLTEPTEFALVKRLLCIHDFILLSIVAQLNAIDNQMIIESMIKMRERCTNINAPNWVTVAAFILFHIV